jgi:hypothetical protein
VSRRSGTDGQSRNWLPAGACHPVRPGVISLLARNTREASSRGFLVVKHPREPPSIPTAADAPDPDEILHNVLPFVMSEELDKARSYVERGRRFSGIDSAALKDAWVETLGKLPPDPLDPELRLALDDTAAELQLRGEDLPAERAQAEVEAFVRSIEALITDGIKADPDAWDRHSAELAQDIREFIQEKRRGN